MILKAALHVILILLLNITTLEKEAGERIYTIFVDEYGSQWFGTNTCLLRKYGKSWTAYQFSDKPCKVSDIKRPNAESPTLWLATSLGPVSLDYNKKNVSNIHIYDSSITTFKSSNISSVTFDNSNTGYFTTFKGIGIFNSLGWRFYTRLIDITRNEYTSAGFKNDTVYLGTNGEGVARIFRKADVYSGASSYVKPWSSLPDDTINCIFIDKAGNQWYGTNKGLCRHYSTEAKDNWDRSFNSMLPGKKVFYITEAHAGNIWAGTNRGLVRIQTNPAELKYWTIKDGLISDTINTIFVTSDQSILIGTNRGVSYFDGKKFSNLRISDIKDKISFISINENR